MARTPTPPPLYVWLVPILVLQFLPSAHVWGVVAVLAEVGWAIGMGLLAYQAWRYPSRHLKPVTVVVVQWVVLLAFIAVIVSSTLRLHFMWQAAQLR